LAAAGELQKRLRDTQGQSGVSALLAPAQIVSAFHFEQRSWSRNQLSRPRQLFGRAERIGGSADEERRHAKVWKVRDPKIARAPRRMERIGLKQEGARQRGLGGEEDRSLPAAIGVPAEEEAAARVLGEDSEGGPESFTIPRGPRGRRRPACPSLAERQITAQDGDPARDEGLSHGHEERPLGVATGSVGEHE